MGARFLVTHIPSDNQCIKTLVAIFGFYCTRGEKLQLPVGNAKITTWYVFFIIRRPNSKILLLNRSEARIHLKPKLLILKSCE